MKKQTDKKEKLKKVGKIVFKIISILGLVWMIILTCLLILGSCSTSVKNSGSKKLTRKSIENTAIFDYEQPYTYLSRYSGHHIYSINWSWDFNNRYNIPNTGSGSSQTALYRAISFDDINAQLVYDGETYKINQIQLQWNSYLSTGEIVELPTYQYRLRNVIFLTAGGNYTYAYKYLTGEETQPGDYYDYVFSSDMQVVVSDEEITDITFNEWFYEGNALTFHFNKQINYNAPLNSNLASAYLINSESTTLAKIVNYDFYFISGGEVFNRLQVTYIRGGGAFRIDDNIVDVIDDDIISFGYVSYLNTYTNITRVVNYRLQTQYERNGGISYVNENSSYWSSQFYQDIYVLNADDQTIIDLSKFNNSSYSVNGGFYYDSTGTLFDLFATAFSSLSSLFSIAIMPSITIGTLLFLPLVAGIVLAIIKVVHK